MTLVKPLPEYAIRDINEKNLARTRANLSLITIKVRKCLGCNQPFMSSGDRLCGCHREDQRPEND